jgi:serine protease Do
MSVRNLVFAACLGGTVAAQMPAQNPAPTPPAAPAAPRAARGVTVMMRVPQGYLGVDVVEVDSDRAKARNLKEERGVEVTSVTEDSPASKAGLRENDIILEYNNQRVDGLAQFIRMVGETPIGRKIALGVFRNGSNQTIYATIGPRVAPSVNFAFDTPMAHLAPMAPTPMMPEFSMPDIPSGVMGWQSSAIGIMSEPIDGQLAEFFGVKEGVLVRSVMKKSPAEKSGLKAGDVIVKVDGNAVRNPREITGSMVRRQRDKKAMSLTIVRNHKEMTIEISPSSEWSSDGRPSDKEVL